jgi:trehalose 6-phosphate phosphatase
LSGQKNPPGGGAKPALNNREEIFRLLAGKRPVIFLDYDGTLTPIVERPEDAKLGDQVRQTLKELAQHCTVAVISGRDLPDVQKLVDLKAIYYAGSHGFDIAGPEGKRLVHQLGEEFLPVLDRAEKELRGRVEDKIPGSQVERKKFSIAVHYRRVAEDKVGEVEDLVDQVLAEHTELRKATGKKIFELQPDIDWHKGKALLWLLEKMELDRPGVLPLYVGDDVTDEDAFEVLEDRGLGLVVQEEEAPTRARYRLSDTDEVEQFLEALIPVCKESADE